MDTADTIVAMRVDIPANVRRIGFNAEPAPDPWSSLMAMNMAGGEYEAASRVIRWGYSVLETRKLMRWCLAWMNGACNACCDQATSRVRVQTREAGGCRHAQVTWQAVPPGGRLPGRIATNLLTHTSIPPLPNIVVENGSNRWIYRSYTCPAETPSS